MVLPGWFLLLFRNLARMSCLSFIVSSLESHVLKPDTRAVEVFQQAMNDIRIRIFNNDTIWPDRFASNTYASWVHWKVYFIAVAEENNWTDAQAIIALPVSLNGQALQEIDAAAQELRNQVTHQPTITRILSPLRSHGSSHGGHSQQ